MHLIFLFLIWVLLMRMDPDNEGLLKQKEELGCAVCLQDVYEIAVL